MRTPLISRRLELELALLYRESIVHRMFGRVVDDRVAVLQQSPLGMFFYNQRALFFAAGALFISVLAMLAWLGEPDKVIRATVVILASFWLLGVLSTLVFHHLFRSAIDHWAHEQVSSEFPSVFRWYFLLDLILVLSLVGVGRLFDINLGIFSLLLFANTVVYGAYVGGGKGSKHVFLALILSILFLLGVVIPGTTLAIDSTQLFSRALVTGPLLGMLFLTVLSVAMISWLRSEEHKSMEDRLYLIGKYEAMLSGSVAVEFSDDCRSASGNRFWEILPEVIKDLCSQRPTHWYRGGCLWLAVSHRDHGVIVVPGPRFNVEIASGQWIRLEDFPEHLDVVDLLVPRDCSPSFELFVDNARPFLIVPLYRGEKTIGFLTLHGDDRPPLLQPQERAFLQSLGSIITNTMEQWDGRYREYPQRAMDDLFKCRDLAEVFEGAAKVMQDHLMASGCMVVFKVNRGSADMRIVAAEGFSGNIYKNSYRVGEGKTGQCALDGKTMRYDDARRHREEFNNKLFENLQRSHGREIRSWMAMPIGPSDNNFGVIKVVNSKSWCGWFTDEHQGLGEDLALRLNVIIEKFLHIKATEEARDEAQRFAKEAMSAKQGALTTAEKREEDLMTMTHQLLGPLSSVVGSITNLQERQSTIGSIKELENVRALVEDAITLCYGTFTSFAHSLGKGPAFMPTSIDAQDELKGLWQRLQMTSGGRDLHFVYREESGFPQLWIDRNVFISVMYSLLHNALKYADAHSTVFLECSFERLGGRAAIKVKSIGEPIQPHETAIIFQKFGRGHLVKSTGRYHAGVGLGLWVARELMRAVGGDITVELAREHPRLSIFIVQADTHAPPKRGTLNSK